MTIKKKKGLKIFLILMCVFLLLAGGFALFICVELNIKNAEFNDINISLVPDGTYTGVLGGNRFGNTVEVTVNGGKIVDIQVVKDMVVVVADVAFNLFDEVIREQSLQVDAVSGATVSTKAYLKAIENALTGQ